MSDNDIMNEPCESYLCRNKLYTRKDVVRELMRIRKKYGQDRQYENDNEFIKASKCIDNVLPETECNQNYQSSRKTKSNDYRSRITKVKTAKINRLDQYKKMIDQKIKTINDNYKTHVKSMMHLNYIKNKSQDPELKYLYEQSMKLSRQRAIELNVVLLHLKYLKDAMDMLRNRTIKV